MRSFPVNYKSNITKYTLVRNEEIKVFITGAIIIYLYVATHLLNKNKESAEILLNSILQINAVK